MRPDSGQGTKFWSGPRISQNTVLAFLVPDPRTRIYSAEASVYGLCKNNGQVTDCARKLAEETMRTSRGRVAKYQDPAEHKDNSLKKRLFSKRRRARSRRQIGVQRQQWPKATKVVDASFLAGPISGLPIHHFCPGRCKR